MKYATFFLVLLLVSCGVTNVIHDYDEQQDFSIYKTYNFFPEMQTGLNELDHKRLLRVTDSLLQAKGLVKSDSPDLYINFKTQSRKEASNTNIGVGVGGGSVGRGGGINIGVGGAIPIGGPVTFMEVTTDFVDVQRDELVWQAVAEKRFYPNNAPSVHEQFFQKVLEKSLTKYPPKKKSTTKK